VSDIEPVIQLANCLVQSALFKQQVDDKKININIKIEHCRSKTSLSISITKRADLILPSKHDTRRQSAHRRQTSSRVVHNFHARRRIRFLFFFSIFIFIRFAVPKP
jgi:hypothetical protein